MKVLYEIFVPTIYGDTMKPIRTAHHLEWDKFVQGITGGLTILGVARGKWIDNGVEYPERIIPVRVMVETSMVHVPAMSIPDTENQEWTKAYSYLDTKQIDKIIQFTLSHYRQKAVMFFEVTRNVQIVSAK